MQNKSLLWIIPSYEKNFSINDTNLEQLKILASEYGYNANFVFLTNNTFVKDEQDYTIECDNEYSVRIYDRKIYTNSAIMKELINADYDNVIITNLRYTKEVSILSQMFEKSLEENVDFVHLQKNKMSFFSEFAKLTKSIYNKIVKMFTNSLDNMYVRNFVMFNRLVLDIMKDFPANCGIIRETNFLAGTTTAVVNIDKKTKLSPAQVGTTKLFIVSLAIFAIAVGLFVVLCVCPLNLDLFLWLIVGFIILLVCGIIAINYSVLKDKIKIDNFSFENGNHITPLISRTFNEKIKEIEQEPKKKARAKKTVTEQTTDKIAKKETKTAKSETTKKKTTKSTAKSTEKAKKE